MATRDEITIEVDRARVMELMKRGLTSAKKIADVINSEKGDARMFISVAQVQNDIKAIKNLYKERQVEDYHQIRMEMIDRLHYLQETLWESFEKSKQNQITVESTSVVDEEAYDELIKDGIQVAKSNERVFLREAKITEKTRPEGNHAFTQQIFQIEDKLSKIYGVDAPSKIALTDPDGEKEASSPLSEILAKLSTVTPEEKKALPASTMEENKGE